MSNSRKMKAEREVKATTYNKNEDRRLEKKFQTLDLERGYAMKLLKFDNRIVRVNYKRLKERVSKIKSHLSAEEIVDLRNLENEGKLKPEITSFNLNGAMKIAAAAKRLKLETSRQRSRSAMSASVGSEKFRIMSRPETTGPTLRIHRSNSVTGAFIDAPEPETNVRRSSIDGGVTIRPLSAVAASPTPESESTLPRKMRPATSVGIDREKTNLTNSTRVSFKSGNTGFSSQYSAYSSHTTTERDPYSSPSRAQNNFNDESIEGKLGVDLYEERRHDLIHEELSYAQKLEYKKKLFLNKVDEYLKENPPIPLDSMEQFLKENPLRLDQSSDEESEEESENMHFPRKKLIKRQFDFERTFANEEAYKKRDRDLWKDMNKCRYLRVPNEKIDLSGVVTLAKDQMKLFQILRATEPSHIVPRSVEI